MVIFDQCNEQIILRNEKYYLRTDTGHFAEHFEEIEISKEDAEKIMADQNYSMNVVWNYRNKKRGLV